MERDISPRWSEICLADGTRDVSPMERVTEDSVLLEFVAILFLEVRPTLPVIFQAKLPIELLIGGIKLPIQL
jgi:hypothetical protein